MKTIFNNMKKNAFKKSFLLLMAIHALMPSLFAEVNQGVTGKRLQGPTEAAEENCIPATAQTDLDINNVRAKILNGGDMWWDLVSNARYEIPINSKKHSLFASSLWIGGIDAGGQLKLAAQTYRQTGNDFWPGPLDNNATTNSERCLEYDRHWKITKRQVQDYVAFTQGNGPQGYTESNIPDAIVQWPGDNPNGNTASDPFLAPYEDVDGDNSYSIASGDYPRYDLSNSGSTGSGTYLYGDQTIFWVFNDKGNIHTETSAPAIGIEVRAQAFGFSTSDEINNMTFYQYEILNKSSFLLTNCYFAYWVDPDLGCYQDDLVGCDVGLGLGICYNSQDVDCANGENTYGNRPAAIGIDFFLGPLADPNGLDDTVTFNGTGYDDGIVDNERLGMEKFMIFRNNNTPQGNPFNATHFYNYMRCIWKDGTPLVYIGNGFGYGPGTPCNFAVPGTSDPTNTAPWAMTVPDDWRMVQSAGPFSLQPGAVNYITAGAVWAQSPTGGAQNSVNLLRSADIKAQALFENNFRVLNGPDAPDLTYQELDRELLVYLTNQKSSNNYKELYREKDPTIVGVAEPLKFYTFQGYQVYQLKNANVSVTELSNPDQSRLVAQCDVKDGISRLINFNFDPAIGAAIPKEMVDGNDSGIVHSFRFINDAFNPGTRLVNYKKYYFTVVAYAHNNYKTYDPIDPNALDGQKLPFKAGRLNIKTYTLIPHSPVMGSGGMVAQSIFGSSPQVTRIEGQGNGGASVDLTQATMDAIVAAAPGSPLREITYASGKSPIKVKVIDPLNVPKGNFELRMMARCFYPVGMPTDSSSALQTAKLRDTLVTLNSEVLAYVTTNSTNKVFRRVKDIPAALDSARWIITGTIGSKTETIVSDTSLLVNYEQIIPEWGLSIKTGQVSNPGSNSISDNNGFLESSISFADNSKNWLGFVEDTEGPFEENWIRSGVTVATTPPPPGTPAYNDYPGFDDNQAFEKVISGGFAPYRMCATDPFGPAYANTNVMSSAASPNPFYANLLSNLPSVNIVITSDKTKWTRCPVFEATDEALLAEGGEAKLNLREHQSVDKEGKIASDTIASSDPNSPNYIGGMGMGWFPGYAINTETGERLNMGFSEYSWLIGENGRDMIWNPTSTRSFNFTPRLGGAHCIYVFNHNYDELQNTAGTLPSPSAMPAYDRGEYIYKKMRNTSDPFFGLKKQQVFRDCAWVGYPLLKENRSLLETDVSIKIRVNRAFGRNYSSRDRIRSATSIIWDNTNIQKATAPVNGNFPMYTFSTDGLETLTNQSTVAKNALEMINVTPNPYYAYSDYETSQLDNRVKIINLPQKCTIAIYTVNGTLIRRITKDDNATTYIDWDMKNQANIPVASGLYLIHVEVPEVGEKVLKWFGAMRPIDLDSF